MQPPAVCHAQESWVPVSRFSVDELHKLISDMSAHLEVKVQHSTKSHIPPLSPGILGGHPISILKKEDLDSELFRSIWAKRRPMVVTEVLDNSQIAWTPQYLSSEYGEETCDVEDCEGTGMTSVWTVEQYFSQFEIPHGNRHTIYKLKDWPPSDRFESVHPQLHADFMKILPVQDYTAHTGKLNLVSHFPLNSVAPDVGPKLYSALMSLLDDKHHGSTRLHLDLADAVNIMTYAGLTANGTQGYATWHIFKATDVEKLREYLLTKHAKGDILGDVIHNQQTFLSPSMLQELRQKHDVCPYVVQQHVGEAVFIPAGCAHQVSNQADCIKVACDFVSPESIPTCLQLAEQFRLQRMAHQWPQDVLPVELLLYYTWLCCEAVTLAKCSSGPPEAPSFACPISQCVKAFKNAIALLDHA
ncbi:hypothetical protein VTO73DRAFT_13148 [Trametes versicolor]